MRYTITLMMAGLLAVAALAAVQPEEVRASSYNGYVKACDGKPVYLRPAEKRTLQLHNQERVSRDKPRLCVNQFLQRAARGHSTDMIQKEYFSHTSRDGTTFGERVAQAGYTRNNTSAYRVGENIAGGSGSFRTPENRHKAWMNSAGHRKNILDPGFRQVGIGVASGEYKGQDNYNMYTVDFGFRRR